jgi:hypothetical protein
MKRIALVLVILAALFAAIQLFRPPIPTQPAIAEIKAPVEVRQVLEKDCYACHSDQRKLAWFDEIAPAYWIVRKDILQARQHLNFSTLGAKPVPAQRAALYEAVNMIQFGAMPLPPFKKLHPEARVTPEDVAILKNYLAPWKAVPIPPAVTPPPTPVDYSKVQPEPNGVAFDPDFVNWKPISTTDRGDNYTFRIIVANDIAIKAIQSGTLSPWPDGARIAKIAWQQQPSPDGLLHPGPFVQVELMIKNESRYAADDGWGWGRWRGLTFKPYGQDAKFANECTGCHAPLRNNDYVYTQPFSTARGSEEVLNRRAAVLPASLPYQPLNWRPITMYVDPSKHTTAMLLGNDAAIKAVDAHSPTPQAPQYPAGSVLALVTWAQREDPHWYSARIPEAPLSVEFVQIGTTNTYRTFTGPTLAEAHPTDPEATAREHFLLNLPPAPLP